jgi:hypothetical protein
MSFDQDARNDGPALTPQPPVSLADCAREGWTVMVNCESCRRLTYAGAEACDAVVAQHPLADAWAEGWITCERCGGPVAGILVEDRGSYGRPPRVIERCCLPGCWPDPEYRRRWRGG